MEIKLYRAGQHDTLTGATCFARSLDAARAYLDNPGFGGAHLYETTVDVDDSVVLDIRSESDAAQVEALVEATGIDMGAVTADFFVMQERAVDALVAAGYQWVRLLDTYPVGAETWVWLYSGDEPELEEIEE